MRSLIHLKVTSKISSIESNIQQYMRTKMEAGMDQRQAAIDRIEAKRSFKVHVSVFILVNAALIGIWLMSGDLPH